MFVDIQKTAEMVRLLDTEHFRFCRDNETSIESDEVDFSNSWTIKIDALESPLIARMKMDFVHFMETCMNVKFCEDSAHQITFVVKNVDGIKNAYSEAFKLSVSQNEIKVTAEAERGLLHGAHYIEKLCAFRRAPYLKIGKTERAPLFIPRISQSVFCMSDGNIDHPYLLTDEYLSLMSHFGINGIHVNINLWNYCRNSSIPELNTDRFEENISNIKKLCSRVGAFGIDIYLVVSTNGFLEDAEVFKKHPDVKGSLVDYPTPEPIYNLCSSSEKVLKCYEESFSNIVSKAPEIGGVIIIVGGEGYIHCFTRPKNPALGGKPCPNCTGKNPSVEVANLINRIAASVHSIIDKPKVFAWPYSARTWSGEKDPNQAELIRNLADDVDLLSNFDTPHKFKLGNTSAYVMDYNIVNIGPSEQFAAQSVELAKRGKRHYAKFESTTEPGWFTLPYLPLHYRWINRSKSMREAYVSGYVAKWRFYGFTGSLPEEILAEMSWDQNITADDLLKRIAYRDFGVTDQRLLDGWKILSDLWHKIPASHMIYGEREFYMKGPAYLGPAHPLIFDVQKRYNLSDKFFTLRGDAVELLPEEELEKMIKNAPPRYSSDLLFTHPFGADAVEARIESVYSEWQTGVALIAGSFGDNPNRRAKMELNVCMALGAHIRTIWNVVKFYRTRNRLFEIDGNFEILSDHIENLKQIISDEIENAKEMLSILDDDVRIGYGHCYGQVYDQEMLREKIAQCEFVRDIELPELKSGIGFHVHYKFNQDSII